jgi:hypothetical protein
MKLLLPFLLILALAVPGPASTPKSGRQEGKRIVRHLAPEPTPPPLLDDELVQAVLLPGRALASWAVTRIFPPPPPPPFRVGNIIILGNHVVSGD